MSHALRREAEAIILPDLPEFLERKYQPQNNDERLALLGVCQFNDLHCAEAGLYAAAFAADPQLVDTLPADRLYSAACAAAIAGTGDSKDGADLSEKERANWRQLGRAWLRAELTKESRLLEQGLTNDRETVKRTLASWRADDKLASLHEPDALAKLTPAERQECETLWNELIALDERAQSSK